MSKKRFFTVGALAATALVLGSAAHAQVVNATAPVTIDGDASEWGVIDGSLTANTGGVFSAGSVGSQFMYLDAVGDDTGDGDFQYPTNATWGGTEYDIGEVRVAYDFNNVYFLVKIAGDADTFGGFGARLGIWVDRSDITSNLNTDLNGFVNFCQSPNQFFDTANFNWDYHFSNRSGFATGNTYYYISDTQNAQFPGPVTESESVANGLVEFALPWSALGGYPSSLTTIQVAVGAGSEAGDNWRQATDTVGEFDIGGSCPYNGQCFTLQTGVSLFDLIGANQAAQEADMSSPNCAGTPSLTPIRANVPVATSSWIAFDVDPSQAVGVAGGNLWYDNYIVRISFSQPTTGAAALDPANYTVSNGSPDNVTVTSVGQGGGFTYLTLSRAITDVDIANGVQLDVSTNIQSDGGNPVAPGSSVDITGLLNIIPVTMDASGDPQTFLSTPRIFGSWDGFSQLFPLTDGTDAYPEIPGDQIEAGDVAGDRILRGRVFTTAGISNRTFAVVSDYDFSAYTTTEPNRRLGAGYWNRPYDFVNNGEPIVLTKPFLSSRLATDVTVTINCAVPDFEFSAGDAATTPFFVQAGGTFGTEGALPTSPASDMPGAADVTGGKLMTYVGTSGGFHNFSTTVTYPAGIPDVGSFRFGYDFGGNIVREEEGDTFGQQGNVGQGSQNVKNTTIHYHLARVASDDGSRAMGRTLNFEFRVVGLDIPPPPSDAILTSVGDWMILE